MSLSWLFYFSVLTTTIIFLLRIYCNQVFRYWESLNIPYVPPKFLLGNFQKGFTTNLGILYKKFYEEFSNERFFGIWIFLKPILMVKDPELLKNIFVKDFMTFHDRGAYYNEKDDPVSAHLGAVEGLKWKNLRNKLSPTFTSGKMKMMFPTVVEHSEELKKFLDEIAKQEGVVEIKEVLARFMTDVIAACAFGVKTDCLRNPDIMFRKMGKKSIEPSIRNVSTFIMQSCLPEFSRLIRLRVLQKDVSEFFLSTVKEVMDYREKNNIIRNDFMQLLIELKNKGKVEDTENGISNGNALEVGEKLTIEEAAAEAFVFYLGGFETSSSTLQFSLYELALNPDIQERLREDIRQTLEEHNNKLTYEAVHSIPYLDQVLDETLRKYPIVPFLQRECNKNYGIPDSNVVIPKGTLIHIPVYGIHMDPNYYPDPEKFDPERFSNQEKRKRHHYTYLPFGEGPRNCIGKRFGQMQARLALVVLLQNYKFEISQKMKGPFSFDTKSFLLMSKGGMHLKISFIHEK